MNRSLIGIVVGVAVAAILLLSACYIVQPSEQALVLQFGRLVRIDSAPGLYFKVPFVQNVVYFDARVLTFDAPGEEVPTVDLKQLDVSAFAIYKIVNPLEFYQTVNNEEGAQARLGAIVSANLRQVLGNASMAAILTPQRAVFMRDITQRVSLDTKAFGIEIIDVRIKRVDLPPANSQAIFARMRTQREQAATQIRAEGQNKAVTKKAEGDKEAVVTVANAQKQGEILRGEGDATATEVYTAAYGRDPSFFDFYRSMQALTAALPPETTAYVGPADGDFFRFFLDQAGIPGAPPAATGDKPAAAVTSP
jgi:membrane protease subunit HflC